MKSNFKLYYSIGEVSKILGINNSKIRFWEKEFEILKPKKNKKGNRRFTENDLKRLKLIHHLLKERKYTISGAKKKIQNEHRKLEKNQEAIEKLKQLKIELIEIRENLKK
tara:strand:+ start:509 stop:838 length:330 start_codon:yes stop_codon:yes gene_type:complete